MIKCSGEESVIIKDGKENFIFNFTKFILETKNNLSCF